MPKTPRRSLRSYLRTAPVTLVQYRDTDLLADLECQAPSPLPRETGYKLGKPAKPTKQPAQHRKPHPTVLALLHFLGILFWTGMACVVLIIGFLLMGAPRQ